MQLRGDLYRNNGWSSGDGVLSSDGCSYGTYVFDLHHLRFTYKAKEFWIFDKALTIVLVLQRRRFKLQSCLWCSICLRSGAKDFWCWILTRGLVVRIRMRSLHMGFNML
ncbi:unnamed protein product, partial [Brassica oleracea var. botrytis]